ncbi:MAG: TetR/AcrR family transcriptional regulator [Desulfobacterales bacterium]|mgnify:FL=1|jgi:TetR/AcrR family transcriptional regulator, cholesterol catabolism regulator|nr:TetR/AcrR family transcriptional regulator [Desulfobacteraceae bacterium]MBT7696636.1 TetR/AcrR family transcriptional regulator [Desulfobacterales bacterium]
MRNKENYWNILDATSKLMVEKGYHGTSIRKISEKVGIQSSTIFYYFKNKDDILNSILKELNSVFVDELKEIVENNDINGTQKLKNLFSSYLGLIPEKKDALKVFLNESKHLKGESRTLFKENEHSYFNMIEQILKQIQEEKPQSFPEIDLRLFARVVYGICNWSLMWYQEEGKYNIDEIVDYYMKILVGNKQ